jgi:hypothetical protein
MWEDLPIWCNFQSCGCPLCGQHSPRLLLAQFDCSNPPGCHLVTVPSGKNTRCAPFATLPRLSDCTPLCGRCTISSEGCTVTPQPALVTATFKQCAELTVSKYMQYLNVGKVIQVYVPAIICRPGGLQASRRLPAPPASDASTGSPACCSQPPAACGQGGKLMESHQGGFPLCCVLLRCVADVF